MTDAGDSGPSEQGYWGSHSAPAPGAPVPASQSPGGPAWTPAWMQQQVATSASPGSSSAPEYTIDAVGAAIIGVGLLMLILALTTLDWLRGFSVFGVSASSSFGAIRSAANAAADSGNHGLAVSYFQWLGYVLVGLTVLTALIAKLTGNRSLLLVGGNVVLAVAGAIITAAAFVDGSPFTALFTHSGVGFWFAFAGFLVVAVGTVHDSR